MPQSGIHYRRKLQELTLLFEISQTLDRSLDLEQVILPVLRQLKEHMGLSHGTVTLLNRQTGLITVEAAVGIARDSQSQVVYSPGEGVTGKVVQSGKPMVIPNIQEETDFLDKTGVHREIDGQAVAFICVPVMTNKDILGALSADRADGSSQSLEDDVRLLSIVASMIAQAVKLRRSVQEERERLMDENRRLKDQLEEKFRPKNIIGNSTAMKEVFNLMAQVSGSEASVLIRGESGTGKELIALAIHYNSPRSEGPFVKVNCSALPETVIESELFGHEKGAFTGAV
jgi:Nif-specific regulatory protein